MTARAETRRELKLRRRFVVVLFVCGALVLAWRSLDLQLNKREFLQSHGDARYLRVERIEANRGMILDRNGEPLSHLRVDYARRRGEWAALPDVSNVFAATLLSSEDRNFYEHHGVDWLAGVAAVRQTAAGERRGASTLTMQLAAYLNPQLDTGGNRGLIDKWRQARQALALERAWTKAQILEAWLNLTQIGRAHV